MATYDYDEWGNCTVNVLAADSDGHGIDSPDHVAYVNPFRYRGYFYDAETGFYYLNSRYYDPGTGRFVNADAFTKAGQDVLSCNMFAYCVNNPIMNFDKHRGRFSVLTKFSEKTRVVAGFQRAQGTVLCAVELMQ